MLCMKKLVPVRILKNHFFETVHRMEEAGASVEQLLETLGKGRARRGMFEGDREEGELEIGQISGAIEDIPTVSELVERLKKEYELCIADLKGS